MFCGSPSLRETLVGSSANLLCVTLGACITSPSRGAEPLPLPALADHLPQSRSAPPPLVEAIQQRLPKIHLFTCELRRRQPLQPVLACQPIPRRLTALA